MPQLLPCDPNYLCALKGRIVHSIKFGELEIIDNGAIVFNGTGSILDVIDLDKTPTRLNEHKIQHMDDFCGKLIIPGFVDAHCHAPQYVFSGTGMDLPLLQWLEKYTFPCEAKFSDVVFARIAYEKSIKRHLKCGTTFASYFATIHNEAGKVLVDVINEVGQRAFVGKVSMDRNCPDFYTEETSMACQDSEDFVKYVLSLTPVGQQFMEDVENEICNRPSRSISFQIQGSGGSKKYRAMSEDGMTVCSVASSILEEPVATAFSCSRSEVTRKEGTSATSTVTMPIRERTISACTAFESIEEEEEDNRGQPEGGRQGKRAYSDLQFVELDEPSLSTTNVFPFDSMPLFPVKQSTVTLLNRPDTPLVMPCITPRFVPTCTPMVMTHLGQLARRYGLPVQSHMSESMNEIQWVAELHPDCTTYAHVYEQFGLLSERTYMAHCCHSNDEERQVLRDTGTSAIHCASSNFMLNSGVMDVKLFLSEGIQVALGTDVAGGYSPSMLDAIRQTVIASRVKGFDHRSRTSSFANLLPEMDGSGASVIDVNGSFDIGNGGMDTGSEKKPRSNSLVSINFSEEYQALNFAEAFHLATLGGAEVLGMGKVLGNFVMGKQLDCLVVDVHCPNSPIDCFGNEDTHELFQKFLFLGDDRNIEHVYVNGRQVL